MTRLKAALLAVVAALTLSSCEFSVYDLPLPGGTDVGEQPIEVTVQFSDVLDLVPQSTVKVNDVSVGMVRDVRLDGYTAEVVLEVREDVDLPANAVARIRQTSLLGEKFVELAAPETGASEEPLADGAEIPLARSGRNPEVEEVFGALSLVLNGGGVAQLKTINVELADALEGREGSVRSVLRQLDGFTGQLDDRKTEIVGAIESLDALARSIQGEQGTIDAALDELPSAIASIDSQREDLVEMLQALNRLGDVGVRVIQRTKADTIASLEALDPVLTQLANAGDDFAKAFQVFLTYPFVDEAVGRDPQVARDLRMGDYTNLAIQLDLELDELIDNPPNVAPFVCGELERIPLDQLPEEAAALKVPLERILEECPKVLGALEDCIDERSVDACLGGVTGAVEDLVCGLLPVCAPARGGRDRDGDRGPLGGLGDGLGGLLGGGRSGTTASGSGGSGGLLGLFRVAPFGSTGEAADAGPGAPAGLAAYDPDLVHLLVPGMVTR